MNKISLSLIIVIFVNIQIFALLPNGDLTGITKIGETMTYTQYLKRHPEEMKIVDKNGQSIFFYIIDNCYDTIPIAVAMGALINEPDYKGRTPLLYAMQLNRPDMISSAKFTIADMLLANGANPNIPDYDGNYPLFIALSKSLAHLPMLCKYNANVNVIDKDGDSFLMRLIKNDEFTDIPSYIIAKKPDVNYQNSKGNTILHEAIIKKLPLMIKTVMSLKPDLSIKNNDGDTPLNLVLKNNIPGVAIDMINVMGKDFVNKENLKGETPLSLAVTCQLDTIVSRDKNNPFDKGTTERKAIVEKLFSLGADVEHKDINGLTPVQLAENPDVTDFLLNICKADHRVLNAKGDNLWFLHAVKNNNESIKFVRSIYFEEMRINKDRNLIINMRNILGINVAQAVCNSIDPNRKIDKFQFMLYGIFSQFRDVTPSTLLNNGTTPIITLVRKNDIEYIDAYRKVVTDFDLLKEIKLTDVQGRNVLHYARKPEIINLFVKLGVDVNAKDKLGFTPLYYAKQGDLLSGCVEALVKAGAKE